MPKFIRFKRTPSLSAHKAEIGDFFVRGRPRAELAKLSLPVVHTVDEYSAAERIEMDAMYERHELLFPDDGLSCDD